MKSNLPESTRPWALSVSELAKLLQTDPVHGLSGKEAEQRRREHGPNTIGHQQARSWLRVFGAQFANVMVALLLAAAVISGMIGEYTDAILIGLIVIANAVVGFFQEWTAEKAVESLRRMTEPAARVCRDGKWQQIPAADLVVGDLVEIVTGDFVPADARLVSVAELETSEASLTGESHPIEKSVESVTAETALPDRVCMAYCGTSAVSGHGRAILTQTGTHTELGRIAELMTSAAPSQTPLQRRLDKLSTRLTVVIVVAACVMFVIGLRQHGLGKMLLTAVGLAVAALPEGLPAVITIGLAIGARRMADRNAIIRRLTAVETLGSVNVICTDKTGTLTQNRMTVAKIDPSSDDPAAKTELLTAAVLCSDAIFDVDGGVLGSPTESAFLHAALENGLEIDALRNRFPRVAEIPFTSTRKRMATLHHGDQRQHILYVKGAIERILPCCIRIAGDEQPIPVDDLMKRAADLAGQGQRVLAFARRTWTDSQKPSDPEEWENSLEYIGLIALSDPVRPEVPNAIDRCRSAGIQPVLITGDHPETARSIAGQLGIWRPGEAILTGTDLDRMSDDQLQGVVASTTVYARVSPEHKLRIVRGHQAMQSVTAMTGDGVNDAPALKQADIGVAMGKNGTDVAKEASAMVLADDNFATIVSAVEEGRAVYDNIRKSIAYLFSGNISEVILLFAALVAGLPLPLIPIQILWINLVTDGLPALAMAFEPPESNIMRRTPRKRSEGLFDHGLGWSVLLVGGVVSTSLLLLFRYQLTNGEELEHSIMSAQTAVFMTLGLAELLYATSARDLSRSFDLKGVFRNKGMLLAITLGAVLQFAVCYVPFLQEIFHTVTLSPTELCICMAVSTVGFLAMEAWKQVVRIV